MSYPSIDQCQKKYPANGHVYRVKNRATGAYYAFAGQSGIAGALAASRVGADGKRTKTDVRPWVYWVCGYLKSRDGGDWIPVRVVKKKAKPKQEMCHIVSGLRVYCEVHGVGWWGFDGSAHAKGFV